MTDLERELSSLRRGQLAGAAGELVDELLDKLEAGVDQRIYQALRAGVGLTAEAAQQAWFEKFAYAQLRSKLAQLTRSGETAARRITPKMEK